ncbi:polynucleotide kinase-phosphatase [Pseudokineococcus sp. 1T1Z-3]|uniref:polynucleotide kinase-phosphatase n=1 Tax=Pseudokineococcus sp. 1T1Z-3 TaxID=3132745 RepID=UPI0030A79176
MSGEGPAEPAEAPREAPVRELAVPETSLVVLVGASGSGKSTFGREAFGPYEVVSSDVCRGMVSGDENDQAATKDAFDLLSYVVAKRLAAGRLTVVDATNVQREARRHLVELARAHDVLPVAVVLDVPEQVCLQRNELRADRTFGAHVVRRQRDQLRRSLRGLGREGFRTVHVLRTPEEVAGARVVRTRLLVDRRDERGPFDVVGDVHGCRAELEALLGRLGYTLLRDERGRPVDAVHPQGRRVVLLGDLVDRGPDSPGVLRLAMGMHASGTALVVPGNHEAKLVRALSGAEVTTGHGLAETLAQLAAEPEDFRVAVREWCRELVSHLVLDGGDLVVAHAGMTEAYAGRASGRVRSFALYGDTTGETDELGLPVRYPWARDYRGAATVLYGHTPVPEPEWTNRTMCLDTGCVFGGSLSALRWPEREVVQVPAEQVWYEPVRPLAPPGDPGAEGAAQDRGEDELDVEDVLGRRVVETAHHGRVSVRAEQAAGALEVVSRFAVHPRWLVHLPPTTAPVATSRRPDLLEHPDEAFAAYAAEGVEQVVCEEKHMGSRALVLVAADQEAATTRFGAPVGETGAVLTRTGRAFLPRPLAEELLGQVRAAATQAGLWEELGTSWLLLDCELLPWTAKAEELVRDSYAAVGAAARALLPAAAQVLETAAARGLDVGELLSRTRARHHGAEAFTRAYRRYTGADHTPGSLDGVQLAPFALLAAEGLLGATRDHLQHLAWADRLVAADPVRFRATQRVVVDTGDAASCAAGVAWWEELCAAGGEGAVVKPVVGLQRGPRGLVQPALKVRGPEYLRLVYGPDYLLPEHLSRLRQRDLGRKRSLALREHALGVESLTRLLDREPLWRVHEAAVAVLALESDPVDPRL